MIRLFFTLFFLSSGLSFALDIQIRQGSMQSIFILAEAGRHFKVDEHYMRVAVPPPSGKTGQYDIRMIYEPSSHLFWWQYQNIGQFYSSTGIGEVLVKSIVYKTETKIVGFKYSTGTIWIRESSDHYSSVAEGQASVVATLNSKVGDIERGDPILKRYEIEAGKIMREALGFDFFHYRHTVVSPEPKIIDVKKDKDWHLIFEGVNKAKAEVILSDDYKVISVALLPDNKPQDSK